MEYFQVMRIIDRLKVHVQTAMLTPRNMESSVEICVDREDPASLQSPRPIKSPVKVQSAFEMSSAPVPGSTVDAPPLSLPARSQNSTNLASGTLVVSGDTNMNADILSDADGVREAEEVESHHTHQHSMHPPESSPPSQSTSSILRILRSNN